MEISEFVAKRRINLYAEPTANAIEWHEEDLRRWAGYPINPDHQEKILEAASHLKQAAEILRDLKV